MRKLLLAGSAGIALALFAAYAQAAPVDDRRSELRSLREQIKQLDQEIARSEDSREGVADELAQSEKAISSVQKRMREITIARQEAEEEVRRLHVERVELEGLIEARRRELGDTVYRVYVEGGQAGARRILGGGDSNQLMRDAYYLEQIALQRQQMIEETRLALDNLKRVVAEAEIKQAELRKLEAERLSEQKKLGEERRKHREMLDSVASRLRAQRKEMASLNADAARMEKLLKGLEKIARARTALGPKTAPDTSGKTTSAPSRSASEPIVGRADSVVSSSDSEVALAHMKGKLRWPVKGELSGRFGAQRAEGGAQWKGVFIRAAQGSEVRVVADGKVAYADWLRGFGNLLIVDHGGEYLSIYGNNDSLLRNPGERVKAGEVIANVGATGGAEESGLYFELRHRGQAQDPVKWMVGR